MRVLQEKRFQPLGSSRIVNVNVRIIAATNRNLEQDILADRFRADLFYRLNVFPIYLPPLRERGSDVILLADHFLLKYNKEMGKHVKRISTAAIEAFLAHKWPGQCPGAGKLYGEGCVDDKNRCCRLHAFASIASGKRKGTGPQRPQQTVIGCRSAGKIFDHRRIGRNGRQSDTKAAKILGTTKRIIQYKVSKMGIDPKHFRKKGQDSEG